MNEQELMHMERRLLGGILLHEGAMSGLRLAPGDFLNAGHAKIFEAMLAVHAAGQPIDGVTLRARLIEAHHLQSAGGDEYLLNLTDTIPHLPTIQANAKVIREEAAKRGAREQERWRLGKAMEVCACSPRAACGTQLCAVDKPCDLANEIHDAMRDAEQRVLEYFETGTAPPVDLGRYQRLRVAEVGPPPKVRIWSFEHDAWWAPDERGYTKDRDRAGLYERARAEVICANANQYQPANSPHEEIRT